MNRQFAYRLRELRLSKNITQKELAKMLEVSPSAVGMYEQGKREPNSEILNKLCCVFGVTVDYLIGREQSKSLEITDVVDDLTEKLIKQSGLMFNGIPIDKNDRKKIADVIKTATEFALKYEAQRKGE